MCPQFLCLLPENALELTLKYSFLWLCVTEVCWSHYRRDNKSSLCVSPSAEGGVDSGSSVFSPDSPHPGQMTMSYSSLPSSQPPSQPQTPYPPTPSCAQQQHPCYPQPHQSMVSHGGRFTAVVERPSLFSSLAWQRCVTGLKWDAVQCFKGEPKLNTQSMACSHFFILLYLINKNHQKDSFHSNKACIVQLNLFDQSGNAQVVSCFARQQATFLFLVIICSFLSIYKISYFMLPFYHLFCSHIIIFLCSSSHPINYCTFIAHYNLFV